MKKLMIVLVLVALGSLIAGDALAGQTRGGDRDRTQDQTCDQTCTPDCTGDGPNSDSEHNAIQKRPGQGWEDDGPPGEGLIAQFRNMLRDFLGL